MRKRAASSSRSTLYIQGQGGDRRCSWVGRSICLFLEVLESRERWLWSREEVRSVSDDNEVLPLGLLENAWSAIELEDLMTCMYITWITTISFFWLLTAAGAVARRYSIQLVVDSFDKSEWNVTCPSQRPFADQDVDFMAMLSLTDYVLSATRMLSSASKQHLSPQSVHRLQNSWARLTRLPPQPRRPHPRCPVTPSVRPPAPMNFPVVHRQISTQHHQPFLVLRHYSAQ